ncbi:hypothetical protein UlMin_034332 [Ulmus minor]
MINKDPILVQILVTLSLLLWTKAHASATCNRACGPKHQGLIPYPFGFSAGCEIQLNCSAGGKVTVGEFPVQFLKPDSVRINIERKCNRPLRNLRKLFGKNFAPTSRNAILLENCTQPGLACEIPSILVQTHFSSLSCSNSSNTSTISCYSESNTSAFIDFENLSRKKCDYLLTSISAESLNSSFDSGDFGLSLEVQVVELAWWLDGNSCKCAPNANCTKIFTPKGNPGYRCNCVKGYEGDGFLAGVGCRKVYSKCSPGRYLSGQCGGTTRIITLVGGITAGASLVISLILMCCFIRRRHKRKASRHSTKRLLTEATGNLHIPIYPYREIEKATNGFSEKYRLGTGAYGTVYAGKLHSYEWVAIKRIRHRDAESIEQVVNEIKLISSVSHPNLVRLLGCSIEYGEQILVYEFMPNGTLSQHLQRERGEGLPWIVRLTIATETAQAIAYLHSAIKPPIYHRDIKSSNILLDHNFRSKVADFGLSRLGMIETSHISTAPQGTPGYLDPQYHQNFQLSDKSDVYSFGVVLVEIITGLKAVDFSRPQNDVNLAALATERIGKGCLNEIIDPTLEPNRDAWTLSSVHKVAELAFRCLAFHRDMRPSMMEVAAELEQIRLIRLAASEENTACTVSSEVCSSSSFSNGSGSEKPLTLGRDELERRDPFLLQKVGLNSKDESPVSVQDPWLSAQSSPSSNSLLSNAIQ